MKIKCKTRFLEMHNDLLVGIITIITSKSFLEFTLSITADFKGKSIATRFLEMHYELFFTRIYAFN